MEKGAPLPGGTKPSGSTRGGGTANTRFESPEKEDQTWNLACGHEISLLAHELRSVTSDPFHVLGDPRTSR